jgi:hypothetical protein
MQLHEVRFTYGVHTDKFSLSPEDQLLIDDSIKACGYAYAPYSAFKVGVAIRTKDHLICIGWPYIIWCISMGENP